MGICGLQYRPARPYIGNLIIHIIITASPQIEMVNVSFPSGPNGNKGVCGCAGERLRYGFSMTDTVAFLRHSVTVMLAPLSQALFHGESCHR